MSGNRDDSTAAIDEPNARDPVKFNPHRLLVAFQNSIVKINSEPVDVYVKDYVNAYTEIIKFMDNLGAIFYFVVVDVKQKLILLGEYLNEKPNHYQTVHKTVVYEKENDLHAKLKLNASRTLLRLHRALLFIYKFLERLVCSDDQMKSSTLCIDVYNATLAKHHTWIAQKGATLGMYTLPRREVLVEYMCLTPADLQRFPEFIKYVDTVYNLMQGIYEKYDLLELP